MKHKKTLYFFVSIAVVTAALHFFGSSVVSPVYTIRTQIGLPASPQESWAVLTDFARYPEWNPYLPRVEGKFAVDELVSFTLVDDNFADPLDLTARLGEVTSNKKFFWVGRAGIQGLFDTKHVFELIEEKDGTTQLHHYEEFRGLIPLLLPQREQRSVNTRTAFEGMNNALAQRLKESGG